VWSCHNAPPATQLLIIHPGAPFGLVSEETRPIPTQHLLCSFAICTPTTITHIKTTSYIVQITQEANKSWYGSSFSCVRCAAVSSTNRGSIQARQLFCHEGLHSCSLQQRNAPLGLPLIFLASCRSLLATLACSCVSRQPFEQKRSVSDQICFLLSKQNTTVSPNTSQWATLAPNSKILSTKPQNPSLRFNYPFPFSLKNSLAFNQQFSNIIICSNVQVSNNMRMAKIPPVPLHPPTVTNTKKLSCSKYWTAPRK